MLVNLIAAIRLREELWLLPELLHLKGITVAYEGPADAQASFREAFELAKTHGAPRLELNVAAECLNAKNVPLYCEARRIIKDAPARLNRALSAPDAIAARRLLCRNVRHFGRMHRPSRLDIPRSLLAAADR
jgi:hypothetical protein